LRKLRDFKAAGGTNFKAAIEGAIRSMTLTSDQLNPVLIFMTDGEGEGLPEACENLKKFAQAHRNLITISVGLGNEYNLKTLESISDNGNK
jgi:uncharacterized protein with von Willebrand factor type A (vWA) domain